VPVILTVARNDLLFSLPGSLRDIGKGPATLLQLLLRRQPRRRLGGPGPGGDVPRPGLSRARLFRAAFHQCRKTDHCPQEQAGSDYSEPMNLPWLATPNPELRL
jgi:hypothetical protein